MYFYRLTIQQLQKYLILDILYLFFVILSPILFNCKKNASFIAQCWHKPYRTFYDTSPLTGVRVSSAPNYSCSLLNFVLRITIEVTFYPLKL